MPIQTADISFNDSGTPISAAFEDIYFSDGYGLQETHYVFIKNNYLLERWQQWNKASFIIAETGFGTGLNFLVTLKLFKAFRLANPTHPLKYLFFISFEKFPLQKQDLIKALSVWEELQDESNELLEHYPLPIEGCHRLQLNNASVHLDLWLGDANQLLPQLPKNHQNTVDAWFLDGFAPSKNPEMWQSHLFRHVAMLSAPNGTFSTFTAAGLVKRGLRDVGFDVEKCEGHGKKRDMLRGTMPEGINTALPLKKLAVSPFWHRTPAKTFNSSNNTSLNVTIIGGGLAGLNCAYSLVQHGINVELFHADENLASGASGNRQGGFYPHLNADFSRPSQFFSQSFLFALQRYKQLSAQGFNFEHDFCGALLLAFNHKQESRHQALVENGVWPKELIHQLEQEQAESLAGVKLGSSGLFIPQAGWINPAQLVNALAQASLAQNEIAASGQMKIHNQKKLINMYRHQGEWILEWEDGSSYQSEIVIMATGHHSITLPYVNKISMQAVRGQVETVQSQDEIQHLKTVVCHKGYLTPQVNGFHSLGATFDKRDTDTQYRQQDELTNINSLKNALRNSEWVDGIKLNQTGRASIRCSSQDHMPIMGNVANFEAQQEQYWDAYKALPHSHYPYPIQQDNLYVLTGLGSRGLCTAPLLAEALACQISGKPLPLTQAQLTKLSPNRFFIKQLMRRDVAALNNLPKQPLD